jgi:hypothetical protein
MINKSPNVNLVHNNEEIFDNFSQNEEEGNGEGFQQ